jgi:peptide deformylase
LAALALDMLDLLKGLQAVGLAAPQVNQRRRLFVMRIGGREYSCVNPRFEPLVSDTKAMSEGCVSFPNLILDVKRYPRIQAHWWDPLRGSQTEVMEGLAAQCFQHELDHLDGKVMKDHVTTRQLFLAERQRKLKSRTPRPRP